MNLVAVSVLRDVIKLNLGCYGGVPDFCNVMLRRWEFGSGQEKFVVTPWNIDHLSLTRKVENQAPSDTASYPRFTDISSNIL